jgi:hypothetical protein
MARVVFRYSCLSACLPQLMNCPQPAPPADALRGRALRPVPPDPGRAHRPRRPGAPPAQGVAAAPRPAEQDGPVAELRLDLALRDRRAETADRRPPKAWETLRLKETRLLWTAERMARCGGFVCCSAPPPVLRYQALAVHSLRGIRSRAEDDRRTARHRTPNGPGSGLRPRMAEGRGPRPPGAFTRRFPAPLSRETRATIPARGAVGWATCTPRRDGQCVRRRARWLRREWSSFEG